MAVISAAQLHAIKAQASGHFEEQRALKERRALHAKSREMASFWPDALQARRQRKQNERQEKLAKEEAARAELDRQDAAEREVLRMQKLEEAAQKLLQQTDDMKTLQRSSIMADVVRQRQHQLVEHVQGRAAARAAESAFLAQRDQQSKEAFRIDEELAHAAKEKMVQLSRAREEQLNAYKARLLAEREAARREGLDIKEQALQEVQQEKSKEEAKREKARRAMRDTEIANQALLDLKLQQKEQERQADKQIADYRAKRAAQDEERAAALATKAAAKEARRREIAQRMESNFLVKQKESDARTLVAAEDACLEEDNTAAEAAERRSKRAANIEKSRREQMAQKRAQHEQRQREQAAFSKHISNVLQAVKLEQEEEAARKRDKGIAHAVFLQYQIAMKQAKQGRAVRRVLSS